MAKILNILFPILIGAVIGYFTNNLAIKMLFHPRKAVMIGKYQLPFTPGIIPKNQSRVAKAVGEAVSDQLFTSEDLVEELKSSAEKMEIAKKITDAIFEADFSIHSLAKDADFGSIVANPAIPEAEAETEPEPEIKPEPEPEVEAEPAPETEIEAWEEPYRYAEDGIIVEVEQPEEKEYAGYARKIGDFVTDKILKKVDEVDLHTMIDDLVWQGVQEYRRNPMLAMILNANVIDQLVDKVETALRDYLAGDGQKLIRNLAAEQVEEIGEKPIRELTSELNLDRSAVEEGISKIFDHFIGQFGTSFSEKTDISGIVREKIEAMNVAELEDLVMSVMKQELQAVINLGALIGAIIGAINIFI